MPYTKAYGMTNEKTILITGGTGTFGRRCAEILLKEHNPKKIIVLSRDEAKQFEMQKTMPDTHTRDSKIRYHVGDIRDEDKVNRAFQGVDICIHTAAMKHIPACEYNPMEAVKTNVLGTNNILHAAIKNNVSKVLALSSDKAVDPINLYGSTKLAMEKLIVASNVYGREHSAFSIIRYGNVLGSKGSVLQVFEEQMKDGCFTITDHRMTRFWITIDAAVRFVIDCLTHMKGGEVFVPKMPSCSVSMIASALDVEGKCSYEEIGIRPGEKLEEVLLSQHETVKAHDMGDYYLILPFNPLFTRDWKVKSSGVPIQPYNSTTNSWQLTVDDVRKMLGYESSPLSAVE
jgi:UDP-N-acetylglucosamine 4,6-dehydratase